MTVGRAVEPHRETQGPMLFIFAPNRHYWRLGARGTDSYTIIS
jgi:hypothetical protein